jgi:two-component system invasion response regulator UvrY
VIRVVLVDDHALVRAGLRRLLEDAPGVRVTGEAGDAEEALKLLAAVPADVVVTDLAMPGRSGLQLLAELRRRKPGLGVVVLSVNGEAQIAARAMRAGAAAYLSKQSAPEQLFDAVRRAASGRRYVSPEVAERIAFSLGHEADAHEKLSAREFEVLRRLAGGDAPAKIAAAAGISIKTVSTYRTRILGKLGLSNTAELIAYAIRHRLVD